MHVYIYVDKCQNSFTVNVFMMNEVFILGLCLITLIETLRGL